MDPEFSDGSYRSEEDFDGTKKLEASSPVQTTQPEKRVRFLGSGDDSNIV